jgi:AraC-like DNA-binding protein
MGFAWRGNLAAPRLRFLSRYGRLLSLAVAVHGRPPYVTPMLNAPTALTVTAAPLRQALQGQGIDFESLARRAGLDPGLMSRPNARYPTARIQRLWELAATACGDPLLGMKVGAATPPGVFHALGLGIVSSASVIAALRRVERYSSIVSTNGRLAVVEHGAMVGLESRPGDHTVMPTTHWVDAMVVALCRLLEQCAGPAAVPARVIFMRPRAAPAEAYRALLKCPVEFDGDHISILFDAASAARPVVGGNSELAAEADRLAERYVAELTTDPTIARVRNLLLRAIQSGQVDQDDIARSLNQSTSTLQRRLRKAGTSYQDLLDSTRRDLALDYLRQGEHSLADIAFLVGFSDQANFTRAFRRWTGKAPRSFLS